MLLCLKNHFVLLSLKIAISFILHQKKNPLSSLLIIGNFSEAKSCKNGRSPRKLHLENNDQILEFIIHNRFFVKKDSLVGFEFSDVLFELSPDNKKILKKWLGNRYTRAAFPDEFNTRLSKSNASKIIEKSL